MQNRPLSSPIGTLLFMRQCEDSLFSQVPPELIRGISSYDPDQQDYEKALQHVANGELQASKALLETKPVLVMFNGGRATTPAGLTLADPDQSLLECALGAGDPEMVAMIKPYFSQFEGGEARKEEQFARYRPLIEAAMNQKPDDLTWLFQIIKDSFPADVDAEFATGDDYDWQHKNPLRDALNKFREAKLAPESRTMTKPRMHCNYQNLLHAFQLLDREWGVLSNQGNDYSKNCLAWRQIIGLIELVELPAYERYLFARDGIGDAIKGKSCERLFNYKSSPGSFPSFDEASLPSRSGVGFDSGVEIFGGGGGVPGWGA